LILAGMAAPWSKNWVRIRTKTRAGCAVGTCLARFDSCIAIGDACRNGSALVKEVREKKDKDKSRLRFWDMAGSKMGQITGLTGEEEAEAAKRAEEAVSAAGPVLWRLLLESYGWLGARGRAATGERATEVMKWAGAVSAGMFEAAREGWGVCCWGCCWGVMGVTMGHFTGLAGEK
jgi:hypothetical protein